MEVIKINLKKLREYNERFKDIPNDLNLRLDYLFKSLNFKIKDLNKLKNSIKRILNIKYTTLKFIFYFEPEATPRARSSRFTKTFYVKTSLDYNELFRLFIEECEDIDYKIITPCKFYSKLYRKTPNNMNKEEKILSELELIPDISRPDWDNLGKTYSDMVQKYLIIDDSLIFDGRVTKHYSIKPRVEITIKFMNEYDSNYNRNKVKRWTSNN